MIEMNRHRGSPKPSTLDEAGPRHSCIATQALIQSDAMPGTRTTHRPSENGCEPRAIRTAALAAASTATHEAASQRVRTKRPHVNKARRRPTQQEAPNRPTTRSTDKRRMKNSTSVPPAIACPSRMKPKCEDQGRQTSAREAQPVERRGRIRARSISCRRRCVDCLLRSIPPASEPRPTAMCPEKRPPPGESPGVGSLRRIRDVAEPDESRALRPKGSPRRKWPP